MKIPPKNGKPILAHKKGKFLPSDKAKCLTGTDTLILLNESNNLDMHSKPSTPSYLIKKLEYFLYRQNRSYLHSSAPTFPDLEGKF